MDCDDGNGCTTDSCNPANGQCVHALCSGGDACTVGTCDPNSHTCSYASLYVCSASIGFSSMSLAGSALATPWDQAGFADGALRLTWDEANTQGMAFFAQKLSVREGFTASFGVAVSGAAADGGDGLALVLHDSSTFTQMDAASGSAPSYDQSGLADPRSIAVELDTSAGRVNVLAAHAVVASAALGGDWTQASTHAIEVSYAPGSLSVSVDGTSRISGAAVDLSALAVDASGDAWLGFTARSGEAESHDVTSFKFVPTCPAGSCGTGAACTAASCDPSGGCQVAVVGGGDTDGDFICDASDACPNSITGDSDGNGICDDVDVCTALQAIALSPAAPQARDAVNASVNLPASVLAGVSLDYAWSVNGVGVVSGDTLPAGATASGDTLRVDVTATSTGRTLCSGSATAVVDARTPTCTSAYETYANGVLTCTCASLHDPDQATSGYACSFTSAQTGAAIGSSTSTGSACSLSTASVPVGSVVSCSVAPTTASATGGAATATTVNGGVPPVAPADLDAVIERYPFGTLNTQYGELVYCYSSRYQYTTPPNTLSFGDPDGVWSTWRIRWSVNGQEVLTDYEEQGAGYAEFLGDLSADYLAVNGRYIEKGDSLGCTIDLWDGAYASSTSASAAQTVAGSSSKILDIELNPDPPTSSSTETCTATIIDYDVNDTVSVDLVANATGSTSDTTVYAALQTTVPGSGDNTSHTVSVSFPTPAAGQTVGCYVTISDPDSGNHTRFVGPTTVQDASPQLSTPVLHTTLGSVCSAIRCDATVTDPDTASGGTQSADVETTWLLDGVAWGSPSVTTYSSFGASGAAVSSTLVGAPVAGKSVSCELRVRQSATSSWSGYLRSDALTLGGTPPSATAVAVSGPPNARNGDTLTCSATVDPGSCTGASYSYLYQWALNGQVLSGQTGSTLSGVSTGAGGQITCAIAVGLSGGEQSQTYTWSPAFTLQPSTWTLNGDAPGSYFGMSVAVSDDIDGDGYGELVVGEPWAAPAGADGGALTSAGKVFVLAGSHSGVEAIADYESGALTGAKIFTGESGGWDSTTAYCTYFTNHVCQPDEPQELDSPYRGPVGDALGTRVLSPGDMDGDGVPDLVFSAPWAHGAGGYREGRVYVVSGASAQGGSMYQYSSGAMPGWALDGEVGLLSGDISKGITTRYGELAGWSIAAGDFDGDGLQDLALGAPEHGGGWSMTTYGTTSWINGGGDLGRAYVTFGSTSRRGLVWLYDVLQGSLSDGGAVADRAQVIEGNQIFTGAECDWGSGLSGAGQLDGDGKDSLLFDTATLGTPWLFHGRAIDGGSFDTATATSSSDVTLISPNFTANTTTGNVDPLDFVKTGKYMMTSLSAGVGDVNGDGKDDLALVWAEPSPYYLVISVFTDPSHIPNDLDSTKTGVGGFVVYGLPKEGWTRSSFQVVPVGDVDGDGLDDFAFWLQPDVNGVAQTTRIYVVYGKKDGAPVTLQQIEAGTAGFTIETGQVLDVHFAVAGGDLDGDGLSDIVWGAPYASSNTGQVGVYFGRDARGKITGAGTPGDDTVTGTSGADVLVGGAGNDTLIGNGGADVLIGGAGDDVLEVADSSFARVRGGRGVDTLKLDSGDLDLTSKRGLISGVEIVDLSSGGHTLTLSDVDVLRTSTSTHTLYVLGGASDKVVTSGGNWLAGGTATYRGHTFNKFVAGNAVLALETSISTTIPPTFTSSATFTIPENTANATPVGTVTAVDPDGYIASLAFVDGGTAFGFDPQTGKITVADKSQLDYESHPTWTLTVVATDNSGLTTTGTITINLTDVPEKPTFVSSTFTTSTYEGADNGTALLELGASDQDVGDVLTWSITSGNSDGAFALNAATGALSVGDGSKLDYETQPVRTLTVQVTDSTGLSDTATVTVDLINVTSFDKTIAGTYARSGVDVFNIDPDWAWTADGGTIHLDNSKTFNLPSNAALNGSLAVTTTGSISYSGTVVIAGNGFNVSVPLSTHLQFPDLIVAGQPFSVTASTALTAPITLSGQQPSMDFALNMGMNNVSMVGNGSVSSPMFGVSNKQLAFNAGPYTTSGTLSFDYGGAEITATRLGDLYPNGVTVGDGGTYDFDLAGAAYAMTGVDTTSQPVTLTNPDIYYTKRTTTSLYSGFEDWNSWLQKVLPDWLTIGSGKVTIPLGAGYVVMNWDAFPGKVTGWPSSPSSEYVWGGLESSYALEWQGAEVTLKFEDGTTQVIDLSEDGSSLTTPITLASGADVNGDGQVTFTASVVPRLVFYNWTKPYLRVDAWWWFGAIDIKVVDEQFNEFSGDPYERVLEERSYGPILTTGVQASDNFDAYLDEVSTVETRFSDYNNVAVTLSPRFNQYRQSFDVNLTPVTIKNTVQFQP